jgi:uncharacterized membrane protein YdcZ (DUF606 family)
LAQLVIAVGLVRRRHGSFGKNRQDLTRHQWIGGGLVLTGAVILASK